MRKAMIAAVAAVAIACVLALAVIAVPQANAATNADWAWPGMQYDIYKANSWYTCSVGFPAWNSAGDRYFISAGHCFRSASGTQYLQPNGAGVEIYDPSNHSTPIGYESIYTNPANGHYDDIALVTMFPGAKLSGNGWEHIPDNPVNVAVGDSVCLDGDRHTNSNCGTVTGVGVSSTLTGYPWAVTVDTANFCAQHGDSGGAVYNNNGAVGILIAVGDQNALPGPAGSCYSTFVPIGVALQILRMQQPSLTL
jgi:Trypsin